MGSFKNQINQIQIERFLDFLTHHPIMTSRYRGDKAGAALQHFQAVKGITGFAFTSTHSFSMIAQAFC